MRRGAAVLLGIALGMGAGLIDPVRAGALGPSVTPILNCVVTDETAGTMDVWWGYASSHADAVTIPRGSLQNIFAPGVGSRDQPETFEPGIHPLVFGTTVVLADTGRAVSWLLDGNVATAEAGVASQACTTPFPLEGPAGPRGPAGPAGVAGPRGPGPGSAVRIVTAQGNRSTAVATCATTEALIGGGGSCTTFVHTSAPAGNAWAVSCKGQTDTAIATAMCVRK
jgi:hypothetical protein